MNQTIRSIRIAKDKNGKEIAYDWAQCREMRMSLQEAKLMVETCSALEVVYGPSLSKPNVKIIDRKEVNGMIVLKTAQF